MKSALGHALSNLEWRRLQGPPVPFLLAYEHIPTGLRVLETDRAVEHEDDGRLWYHVSCSYPDRLPSHDDMLCMKRAFCPGLFAFQIFPPEDKHISGEGIGALGHRFTLHLWACTDENGAGLPDFGKHGHI